MNKIPNYIKEIIAIVATMVMLSIIHAPYDLVILAPVAYVPLVLAFSKTRNPKRFILFTFLASIGYWMFNIFWLINIIAIGWIGASAIMALFILLFVWALARAKQTGWGYWLSLPIIVTGIEFFYGGIFGGFKWHLLGHSLYKNLELIQIADITGVAGITFLIAMLNGLVCDIIMHRSIKSLKLPITVCAIAVASVIVYGKYRLQTEPQNFRQGPLIAIVQSNVPSTVKEDKYEGMNILEGLFKVSEKALASGAELLVWPETIVSSAINSEFLIYMKEDSEPWQYHKKIKNFTDGRTYLLTGATALKVGKVDGENKVTDQYNSAFLYSPNHGSFPVRYDKIHLVPFGEYIPPKNIDWIRNIFLAFNPYDYDYTLTAGENLTRFQIKINEKEWNFSAMICYEDTDAQLNRKLTYSKDKGKADWLLNISNDGWYVWYEDGKVKPSSELPQRTAISVFRAVENRITLMRSVNTGISCKIDPLGRIVDGYIDGTLPENVFDRQAVEGYFTDRPEIDSRVTFFTQYGTLFSKLTGVLFVILIILSYAKKPRKKAADK